MSTRERHLQDWNDALQDWLDGELAPIDRARFEAHLAACAICHESIATFERLDAALAASLPPVALSDSFDRRLLARIDASDEQSRVAKRSDIERQMQAERLELARGWRRTLAILVPSIVAGITVAFALAASLSGSEAVRSLIASGSAALGQGSGPLLQLAITSFMGAGIGLLIARWVSVTND
jgi:anti-sigma factor RsiW